MPHVSGRTRMSSAFFQVENRTYDRVSKRQNLMSTNGLAISSHRIAILMSVAGRFLECRDCQRNFAFPVGTHYPTIAKQFESHSCPQSPSKDNPPSISRSK